jgi:broad specificity phosphatase PhoE
LKTIYLIRHGQTDLNLRRIVQGSGVDAPLNATGWAQAEAFLAAYGHIPFDRVYTSVLQRAIQSVQGFLDLGIPHTATAALNEISWGRYEGIEATPDEHSHYMNAVRRWADGAVDDRLEGGESPAEVATRQQPFLAELFGDTTPAGTYLVSMHGRAMRILLTQLLRYPLAEMDSFPHENLALYELIHTGTLVQVRRFNDQRHLATLLV